MWAALWRWSRWLAPAGVRPFAMRKRRMQRCQWFTWGPGYWARGRADWDWTPSHYGWTPRGYIYVDG
jgi:hypothetical protein